jgi:hypothetical protein
MKYAPIPFDDRLLQSALAMKKCGLPWTPETGCFVWDPLKVIQAPSPFPKRIYFILSMPRFMNIFGDIDTMQEKLVWLPTWHQATLLCRELKINVVDDDGSPSSETNRFVRMYQQIASTLSLMNNHKATNTKGSESEAENRWVEGVIEAELVGLDDLPGETQQWIRSAYSDVAIAYLGWRRIQENKSDRWLPPERFLDPDLLSDLGHFFSDYQHQIRTLESIRRTLFLLRSMDPETDPDSRKHLLQVLSDGAAGKNASTGVLEQLMTPNETHAIS